MLLVGSVVFRSQSTLTDLSILQVAELFYCLHLRSNQHSLRSSPSILWFMLGLAEMSV